MDVRLGGGGVARFGLGIWKLSGVRGDAQGGSRKGVKKKGNRYIGL
jgi:hypothetical protein